MIQQISHCRVFILKVIFKIKKNLFVNKLNYNLLLNTFKKLQFFYFKKFPNI